MRGRCWVGYDGEGVSHIFKTYANAVRSKFADIGNIKEYPRREATREIRQRVLQRAGNQCEDCGKLVTWETMNMHEKIHRGDGGEISLENSIAVCFKCHTEIEHGNRRLRFGE
jgi:5-methylcytosine-specific restriction endonuclease McrA